MEPVKHLGLRFLLLPFVAASAMTGQTRPPAVVAAQVVEFRFSRPGVPVPSYSIRFDASGDGSYQGEAALSGGAMNGAAPERGLTPLHAGPAVLARLLAAKESLGQRSCETRQKHIANTGEKTLTYSGEGAPASCTFNYSDTPVLNDVASAFIALAETVQAGDRLIAKHRFDRLGLDPEMESLDTAVKSGRALEVGNIAPVLRSIAEDERVIDRVRRKAARLLQDSGSLPAEADGSAAPPPSER